MMFGMFTWNWDVEAVNDMIPEKIAEYVNDNTKVECVVYPCDGFYWLNFKWVGDERDCNIDSDEDEINLIIEAGNACGYEYGKDYRIRS